MRVYTVLLLVALAAVAYSIPVDETQNTLYDQTDEAFDNSENSEYERSPRTKRGLLLLKKKLLLGALGLKAAKIGALGLGVAGAFALKSKASSLGSYGGGGSGGAASYGGSATAYGYSSSGPNWNVKVHRY